MAVSTKVRKFILVSFPHVEEATTPEARATGRLDVEPKSIHARTRLEAEKYLFTACENKIMHPLVLRAGVVYGRGVKLTDAARWLMRKRILAVWLKPTWVHLLALPDFLTLVERSIERDNLSGIYNLCDDRPLLIQEFLDRLAAHWGYRKPRRLPAFAFYWAASLWETCAIFLHTSTPLTRDIVDMAMTSVVADTARMKQELMPQLAYPTVDQGLTIV